MCSPYESQFEAWLSPIGVEQVLSKFKMIPKMERRKNMVNQESFLPRRTIKIVKQLKKHSRTTGRKR
ncbi:hypothetical protein PVK06_002463 [Gossypium arboreum]|uniref:Uncharacterized protein n=1 Tax=Gossypium arboreum TaxID=29729 RepID=A0ABR0R3Q9_GOSAR|nr:hypothetical protein PVK06_002463 [Gossypium arboreum]